MTTTELVQYLERKTGGDYAAEVKAVDLATLSAQYAMLALRERLESQVTR